MWKVEIVDKKEDGSRRLGLHYVTVVQLGLPAWALKYYHRITTAFTVTKKQKRDNGTMCQTPTHHIEFKVLKQFGNMQELKLGRAHATDHLEFYFFSNKPKTKDNYTAMIYFKKKRSPQISHCLKLK